MLAFLLTLAISAPPQPPAPAPAYETSTLHAFLAAANNRVIDGIAYGDGHGALSAGLVFGHPSGFFAGTEFARFRGQNESMPAARLASLDSFAGWEISLDGHQMALELLDYRLDSREGPVEAHQGFGARYRWNGLDLEIAREWDKPYYYPPRDAFFSYDIQRASLAWRQPLSPAIEWSLALGAKRIDRLEVRHRFAAAAIHWRWQGLEWQLAATYISGDIERLSGPDTDRAQFLLRIAKPFRIF
ncbi:MAG TPA: hypothetical protein VF267_10590 [Gammaproteobacteria bacterium]